MKSNEKLPIEFKNPGRTMTYTYVISLSIIAFLSIVVHFMLDQVISQQSQTGSIVNISGQQRMLSQRTSMFTIEYLTLGSPDAKNFARESLRRMLQNHSHLLSSHFEAMKQNQPSPLSSPLQRMYFDEPLNVDAKLQLFTAQIEQALSLSTEERSQYAEEIKSGFLALARQPLLEALHAVVVQYEQESVDRVNDLRFAQNVVLCIIILTILVEAMFIFRPMVARISKFAIELQRDANFDHLSELLNRRAFHLIAKKAVAFSARSTQPLSVVIFDIDHFKRS